MDFNYSERLLYHLFQVAVRATVSAPGVSLGRMLELLKLAAYDELTDIGMNRVDIASHLKIAVSHVNNLASIRRPSAQDGELPLPMRILEELVSADQYRMEEVELRTRVLTGAFDPDDDGEDGSITPKLEVELDRALRYLIRQGLLEPREQHGYGLTELGIGMTERDLTRPIQRSMERLAQLTRLSLFLAGQPNPLSEAQLRLACGSHRLPLSEPELEALLAWCEEEPSQAYLVVEKVKGLSRYSAPGDVWLTPRDKPADKQFTLLSLVDEAKEFIHWVSQEPDQRHVAVKTLYFKVLPEDLHGILVEHRQSLVARLQAAERRVAPQSEAIQYALSWFGRVVSEGGRHGE